MTNRETLLRAAAGIAPINTHCHHLPDSRQHPHDLDFILGQSYVGWAGLSPGNCAESRQAYLSQVRHKSYFVWLERALQDIYGFAERIGPGNWDDVSRKILAANGDPARHLDLLTGKCGYTSVILDCYWKPGDDNGRPDIFRPAFRIDPFLWAYAPDKKARDGWSFGALHRSGITDLDSLCAYLKETIRAFKEKGCVALKSAVAYERGIAFTERTAAEASLALAHGEAATADEIDAFQSFMFFKVCAIAGETGLPFQVHTGLGGLRGTRAIELLDAIESHPETKFVLFHGSYPWSDDVCALVHNHRNVFVDLCWLPIISPTRARVFIKEMVELGTADRMSWGCDTWTGEESYGALLAARDVLSSALGDLVDENWLPLEDARAYIERVLRGNAVSLYGVR